MAESRQHTLDRIRSPRVQITYDVEIGDAIEKKELPFVVGVLADLSGNPENPLPPMKNRKFVEIDRDNFMDIMAVIHPRLVIRVANKLSDENPEISVELTFKEMSDFEPQNLAKNIPALAALYQKRTNLKNLIAKMDGNDALETLLTQIMKNNDNLQLKIKEFEQTGKYSYQFGFEESYGCLIGTHARDKDAICAVMSLCEAAAYYKDKGLTLWDQMISIYKKYGYYKEEAVSLTFEGVDGANKITKILDDLRNEPLTKIGNFKVIKFRDYRKEVFYSCKR